MRGIGTRASSFPVTNHAAGEEQNGVSHELHQVRVAGVWKRDQNHETHSHGKQRLKDRTAIPAMTFKAENKRKQVEAQRQNPEKGDDGNFLADEVCGRKQKRGSARGQANPTKRQCPSQGRDGTHEGSWEGSKSRRAREVGPRYCYSADAARSDVGSIAGNPDPCLSA